MDSENLYVNKNTAHPLHSQGAGLFYAIAKLTMYNFCERIISSVVVVQDEGRKYKYHVNYTMGMMVCLDFYRALVNTDDVYELILKYIEAIKPGRSDKRKMKPRGFVCFTYRVAA